MVKLLLLFTLSVVPRNELHTDEVDCIEINHLYNETGSKVFIQLIFWDITYEGMIVRDWRLVDSCWKLPRRNWKKGGYIVRISKRGKAFREILARTKVETHKAYDPELVNREKLPKEKRRGLISVGYKKSYTLSPPNIERGYPTRIPR